MTDANPETKEARIRLLTIMWGKGNFLIAKAKILRPTNSKVDEITVKGTFYPNTIGSVFNVSGHFQYNERYRKYDLIVKKSQYVETTSEEGVVAYLTREGPNVGPIKAAKIYSMFGEDTIGVLRDDPERVAREVAGFSMQRAKDLSEYLKQDADNIELKKWLYSLKLTGHQIGKIFDFFGHDARRRLRKECYRLTAVDGFGFATVSRIGEKLGIPDTDQHRLEAGVWEVLKQQANRGDTLMAHDRLINEACKLMAVHKRFIIKKLQDMISSGKICTNRSDPLKHSDLLAELKEREGFHATGANT